MTGVVLLRGHPLLGEYARSSFHHGAMPMTPAQTPIPTDVWVPATWEDYQRWVALPEQAQAQGYYHNGRMRLEMPPLGNPHSRDHFIVLAAIVLYAGIRGLNLDGHDNCTYRQAGYAEAQPNASFYIGEKAEVIPWETTIIGLNEYPAPDWVIEVAYSSLKDSSTKSHRCEI